MMDSDSSSCGSPESVAELLQQLRQTQQQLKKATKLSGDRFLLLCKLRRQGHIPSLSLVRNLSLPLVHLALSPACMVMLQAGVGFFFDVCKPSLYTTFLLVAVYSLPTEACR